MKNPIVPVVACLIFFSIFFCGCASVEQTLYLGNVKVDAPITPPPTHVTSTNKPGAVTISPKILVNPYGEINAATEGKHSQSIKFTNGKSIKTDQQNLKWKFSSVLFGADIDVNLSKNAALFGGLNFASSRNVELLGGNIGVGLFSDQEGSIFRVDVGANFQNYSYDAFTIVLTNTQWYSGGSSKDTSFYSDRNTEININPFISFIYSSRNEDSPVNFFISLSYFTQNLLGFKPNGTQYQGWYLFGTYNQTDMRSDCKVGFVSVNPGIVYSINENVKLIGSVKVCAETLLEHPSNSWFILPALQVNFQL
jgi:hypothetical protein